MNTKILVVCAVLLAAGCGGANVEVNGKAKAGAGKATLGRMDEGTRCQTEGRRESLVDLNQDDVADVRKVYMKTNDTEVLVCREADLNFDGTKDVFYFFDEQGQLARDEVDLDYDGQIDIISTYAKGKVIKQEIDTNSDGVVDRVRYLEEDVPIRVEGDTDGDRRIDYWEYYEGGKLVRIGIDEDGDGRADSWSRDDETEAAAFESDDEEEEPADEEEEASEEEESDEDA